MLENETFENFFAKSAKEEEGRWGGGDWVQKIAEKSALSDEMHLWMARKVTNNVKLSFRPPNDNSKHSQKKRKETKFQYLRK